MFVFKAVTILAVVAAPAFAHPAVHTRNGGSCSTGTLQCCDSIAPAGSDNAANILGAFPFNLQGLSGDVGVNCNPFDFMGGGTAGTCSAQAACCQDIQNNGDYPVGVDCSPINTGI